MGILLHVRELKSVYCTCAHSTLCLQVNPDEAISHELKGWYETSGKNLSVKQMSSSQGIGGGTRDTPHKTFTEIKESNLQVR